MICLQIGCFYLRIPSLPRWKTSNHCFHYWGCRSYLDTAFDPSGFSGTRKGNSSYLFIRLLFILMVHRVTAGVKQRTVNMNEKNDFWNHKYTHEWQEGVCLLLLEFGLFTEHSGLILRVTVGGFSLIKKPLASPWNELPKRGLWLFRCSQWMFPEGVLPLSPEVLFQAPQLALVGD